MQCERRLVVDHVHHLRLLAGFGAGQLDDGVHVAEARVVGAGHDARHRRGRAGSLVDADVEAFGGEVALLLRPEDEGVNALVLPVEGEADLCFVLRVGTADDQQGGAGEDSGDN